MPSNPNRITSSTVAGVITGICQVANVGPVSWGIVELLFAWSSPANANTPPCFAVPKKLECLNWSPLRSTPGPFPYQKLKTPSTVPGDIIPNCCVPCIAATAKS